MLMLSHPPSWCGLFILYGGLAIDGLTIRQLRQSNQAWYARPVMIRAIFSDDVASPQRCAPRRRREGDGVWVMRLPLTAAAWYPAVAPLLGG
jgi:hypothetical protein